MDFEKYDVLEANRLLDIAEVLGITFAKQLREKKYSINILNRILEEAKMIEKLDRQDYITIEKFYKEEIEVAESNFEKSKKELEKKRLDRTRALSKRWLEDTEYILYCETAAKSHEGLE